MRLTLILYILTSTLSSASFFSPQHYHHDSTQQPQERIANLPPDPCILSTFSPAYGRCLPYHFWCCALHHRKPYCGCCKNRKFAHESDNIGFSDAEVTARTMTEIQKVTTLEVVTEVEPGNNGTLVSLFDVQCNKGQHVACKQADCGFACGCYEHWNDTEVETCENGGRAFDDSREGEVVQKRDAEPDIGEVTRHKFNKESSEKNDGDAEVYQQDGYADFGFRTLYWSRCPPGLYWICCLINCNRTKCYCTDVGVCE
jgi:hypothetical protein